MVIQTARSTSCCHGRTDSPTLKPWPENSAYKMGRPFGGDPTSRTAGTNCSPSA
jgi:hypothetical protein